LEFHLMPPATKLTREEIESRAQETLREHGLLAIPVDPVLLAKRLGIKVHNAVFSEDNIAGMVRRKGSDILMLVKETDPPFRKRFTIAHELGHHFLHGEDEIVVKDLDLFRSEILPGPTQETRDRIIETQANQFAAALLMPKDLVTEEFSAGRKLPELARFFNVSQAAMGYRLNSLRLI
jgi:Zn-dependent peptidase ImmA (M78 family)